MVQLSHPYMTTGKTIALTIQTYVGKVMCLVFIFNLFIIYYYFYFTISYWFYHTSTWICHGCTCVPHRELPSHLPPYTIPLGHPSTPAPSILYQALNLDKRFISYLILHVFQCHSPKSSHPLPLSESKSPFYTSVSLLLSRIQGYSYHLSKFHIYVLVYCIGVFLSEYFTLYNRLQFHLPP